MNPAAKRVKLTLGNSSEFGNEPFKFNIALDSEHSSTTGSWARSVTSMPSLKILDYGDQVLKDDHENRPLWVTSDFRILVETFSPVFKYAYDFLIAVAEPICRPLLIHEYKLTKTSLLAAVSIGLPTEEILAVLERLSKVYLPAPFVEYIRVSTASFGKLKMVLRRNRFFLESPSAEVLHSLLRIPAIAAARVRLVDEQDGASVLASSVQVREKFALPAANRPLEDMDAAGEDFFSWGAAGVGAGGSNSSNSSAADAQQPREVLSFQILHSQMSDVMRLCVEHDMPALVEYDFRQDTDSPNLDIDLKPTAHIRPYQEKSLSKMFGNGRAKSGIIVLPCGAGKTLTAITAATTVGKSCVVLCTSSVAVEQWRRQFLLWTTIKPEAIACLLGGSKAESRVFFETPAGVLITSYAMIAHKGNRSEQSKEALRRIRMHEWGMLILDEVHVAPADEFRKVVNNVPAHCRLGLTATLVREDEKVDDLRFLIGPKLYEADWMDLCRAGYISNVQCAEVWCPMMPAFYEKYIDKPQGHAGKWRKLLYTMNPNKFRYADYLIRYHEARGDKIIVFSDDLMALRRWAHALKKYYLCGDTSAEERLQVFSLFQTSAKVQTIGLSKIGDNSIDLPEANVIIQISSQFGSRRQEAQRLGRILRPKERGARPAASQEANAFYYSLVSRDTTEMVFSGKRQQFLVDQGYTFKIVTDLPGIEADQTLAFSTPREQADLMAEVMQAALKGAVEEDVVEEDRDNIDPELGPVAGSAPTPVVERKRFLESTK